MHVVIWYISESVHEGSSHVLTFGPTYVMHVLEPIGVCKPMETLVESPRPLKGLADGITLGLLRSSSRSSLQGSCRGDGVCVYTYMYTHTCVCMCIYIYIHI